MVDELQVEEHGADPDDAYALDDRSVQAMQSAVQTGDAPALVALIEPLHAADIADVLEQFDDETRNVAIALLGMEFDGEILSELSEITVYNCVRDSSKVPPPTVRTMCSKRLPHR